MNIETNTNTNTNTNAAQNSIELLRQQAEQALQALRDAEQREKEEKARIEEEEREKSRLDLLAAKRRKILEVKKRIASAIMTNISNDSEKTAQLEKLGAALSVDGENDFRLTITHELFGTKQLITIGDASLWNKPDCSRMKLQSADKWEQSKFLPLLKSGAYNYAAAAEFVLAVAHERVQAARERATAIKNSRFIEKMKDEGLDESNIVCAVRNTYERNRCQTYTAPEGFVYLSFRTKCFSHEDAEKLLRFAKENNIKL